MTPQEKHPKFYSHSHYWINAIEVECVIIFRRPVGLGVQDYNKGEMIKLTPQSYDWLKTPRILERVAPKFKPQEGEQFLKDLGKAVSAGCYDEPVTKSLETKWDITFILNLDDEASITIVKAGLDISLSHGVTFNGALYVDKLRELGYYL